ncbi:hypothetical protein D3C87_1761850 [compost metagenome]
MNSQNGPWKSSSSANQCNSSLWAMPAMCNEVLLSGPNSTASVAPASVRRKAFSRVSRL